MKNSVKEDILKKFRIDINNINLELRKNALEINVIAKRQKELKNIKKGLIELIRKIK